MKVHKKNNLDVYKTYRVKDGWKIVDNEGRYAFGPTERQAYLKFQKTHNIKLPYDPRFDKKKYVSEVIDPYYTEDDN